MKKLKIPALVALSLIALPLVALSLVLLPTCGTEYEYYREMEELYRAECAKRGQGGAYVACRKALIEERYKNWQENIDERHRKRKEQRKIETEANR